MVFNFSFNYQATVTVVILWYFNYQAAVTVVILWYFNYQAASVLSNIVKPVYIVAVNFSGGGNQRKPPTFCKLLTNLSHKFVSSTPRPEWDLNSQL